MKFWTRLNRLWRRRKPVPASAMQYRTIIKMPASVRGYLTVEHFSHDR